MSVIPYYLKDVFVSWFPRLSSSSPISKRLLDELLLIKSGYYKEEVLACRNLYKVDKKKYSQLKAGLPAVTFSGQFNGGHKKELLTRYNNVIVIDIDRIEDADILSLKEKFKNDPYIFACWISPSGNGLKLLIRIPSNILTHKFYFNKIWDYLFATYGIEADTSGSDYSRLCFVSYDTDIILKEEIEIFPIHEDEWSAELFEGSNTFKNQNAQLEVLNGSGLGKTEKTLFYQTEGRNRREDRETSRKIITYLKKNGLSITESYPAWLKVGFAIANSFTYDIGKEIFLKLCRLDGPLHDEYKSECLLQFCYIKRRHNVVNFATIIYMASLKGFLISLPNPKAKPNM